MRDAGWRSQEDPTNKKGVIGAFCRTYSITQAMDKFIPGMYEETDIPGRYTYTGGSTTGGAIVYDGDLFLYSHHATDPCSGQLVNAFDHAAAASSTETGTARPKRERRLISCPPLWP